MTRAELENPPPNCHLVPGRWIQGSVGQRLIPDRWCWCSDGTHKVSEPELGLQSRPHQ